jgi:hypothetical protein
VLEQDWDSACAEWVHLVEDLESTIERINRPMFESLANQLQVTIADLYTETIYEVERVGCDVLQLPVDVVTMAFDVLVYLKRSWAGYGYPCPAYTEELEKRFAELQRGI